MGVVNSLKVRHKTGSIVVEDDASIAALGYRVRKHLSLASLEEESARAAAQRVLAARAMPQSEWKAGIEVDAGGPNAPYSAGGWRPADTLPVNGDPMRCVDMRITFDDAANPFFDPTFGTRQQLARERAEIALSKAGNSMDGTSMQATPLQGIDLGVSSGQVKRLKLDNAEAAIPSTTFPQSTTAPFQVDEPTLICRVSLTQTIVNSTNPTTVNLIENGSPKSITEDGYATGPDMSLPAGHFKAIRQPEYLVLLPLVAVYQWQFTSCDPETGVAEDDARHFRLELVAVSLTPGATSKTPADAPWA
jgi:hypothetical protein